MTPTRASAHREAARRSDGRFGEQPHPDPGQLQLHEPSGTVALNVARAGDPVQAVRADRTVVHATMLSGAAVAGRRFIVDEDGGLWEASTRTGKVTAAPDELARRTRVAAIAGAEGLSGYTRGTVIGLHLDSCSRAAAGRRLHPAEAVEEYRVGVEAGDEPCGCLTGRL